MPRVANGTFLIVEKMGQTSVIRSIVVQLQLVFCIKDFHKHTTFAGPLMLGVLQAIHLRDVLLRVGVGHIMMGRISLFS